ncbi:MAG: ATP-binding cassette domain-containing protein [Actinomycetota bacterium]|nr:ATP-binding cassette domain-containing protein [Actinomycetota bacterium]
MIDRPPPDVAVGNGNVAVSARNLNKSYGDTVAVSGLSFDAGAGEVMGLLGPNGAGKTTTIKMLTTLLPIDTGSATIIGLDVAAQPDAVRRVIGLAGQAAAVDEKLTARENLEMFGRLYKIPRVERKLRIDHLVERFDLGDFADRIVETYSGGQRRRLDVVASLIAAPPVLFLDEPTTGLDPRSRTELWDEIGELAAQGTAVVLTTQYLEEADRLSDRIVIIDEGVMKASGTSAELKTDLERDVFEVHVTSLEDLGRAVEASERVAPGVWSDTGDLLLQIPLTDGSRQSLAVLRELDTAGVRVSDFQLRRPTLDDVFLTLTATGGNR